MVFATFKTNTKLLVDLEKYIPINAKIVGAGLKANYKHCINFRQTSSLLETLPFLLTVF